MVPKSSENRYSPSGIKGCVRRTSVRSASKYGSCARSADVGSLSVPTTRSISAWAFCCAGVWRVIARTNDSIPATVYFKFEIKKTRPKRWNPTVSAPPGYIQIKEGYEPWNKAADRCISLPPPIWQWVPLFRYVFHYSRDWTQSRGEQSRQPRWHKIKKDQIIATRTQTICLLIQSYGVFTISCRVFRYFKAFLFHAAPGNHSGTYWTIDWMYCEEQ